MFRAKIYPYERLIEFAVRFFPGVFSSFVTTIEHDNKKSPFRYYRCPSVELDDKSSTIVLSFFTPTSEIVRIQGGEGLSNKVFGRDALIVRQNTIYD